ncbi:MAG: hypothetical protein LBQ66_01515 [Planctomycetaceae bacterium]|nr:hypothetical protein [Planctomycetaceae bacterium]
MYRIGGVVVEWCDSLYTGCRSWILIVGWRQAGKIESPDNIATRTKLITYRLRYITYRLSMG